MTQNELSTNVAGEDDRALLGKAQEIAELFQRAIKLGYSITFSPEQLKTLVEICENGHLIKTTTQKSSD